MSITYQYFCDRLKEERLRMEFSQLEIGQSLRMSQSHYSKAELGKRRLSYYELQYLCETQADVFYVFTGIRSQTEIDTLFFECTFEELQCYLRILCEIVLSLCRNKIIVLPSVNYEKFENIQYALMSRKKGKTIFYKLRTALSYNQKKIADLLKVDVKKLRGMESRKILPDSEIIWQLSEVFGIPYALLLKDKKGLICEISSLLNLFEENKRKVILDGINFIHKTFC